MISQSLTSLAINIIFLILYSYVFEKHWIQNIEKPNKILNIFYSIAIGITILLLNKYPITDIAQTTYDIHTIIFCLMGMFFGKLTTFVACSVVCIYEYFYPLSSNPFFDITCNITASIVGCLCYYINPNWYKDHPLKSLIITAYITHIIMYLSGFLFDIDHGIEILKKSYFGVLFLLPSLYIVLGMQMCRKSSQWKITNELQTYVNRLNIYTKVTQDCFFELDENSNFRYLSDSTERLTGYNPKNIIGQNFYQFVKDNQTIETAKNIFYKISENFENIPFSFIIKIVKKDNQEIVCKINGIKNFDKNGKVLGYVGIMSDISNQYEKDMQLIANQETIQEQIKTISDLKIQIENNGKRINQLSQENLSLKDIKKTAQEEKNTFLNSISQELYTPIKTLNGFIDILLNHDISERERQKISNITKSQNKEILSLIEDIIDINKIESKQLKINETIDNLNNTITDIYDYFHSTNMYFDKKPINFVKKIDLPENQMVIKTDFKRLKQILKNILANAYKYTALGTIKIYCTSINDGKDLLFEIKDNGRGISEKSHNLVYQKQEIFNKTVNVIKSAGLGLSIAKGLVELLEGQLWFESYEDNGTTFSFTIPYKKIESYQTSKENYNWNDKSVIIATQDKISAIYICEILIKTNIKYQNIDQKQLLEIQNQQINSNLLIMDENLKINYEEFYNNFKKNNPQIPILIISEKNNYQNRTNLSKYCKDFIKKPIGNHQLLKVINFSI